MVLQEKFTKQSESHLISIKICRIKKRIKMLVFHLIFLMTLYVISKKKLKKLLYLTGYLINAKRLQ